MCVRCYHRWRRTGSTRPRTRETRFWALVAREPEHWPWQGFVTKQGYGQWKPEPGVTVLAHRWAWADMLGPIPPSHLLRNTCGLKSCCDPTHWRCLRR